MGQEYAIVERQDIFSYVLLILTDKEIIMALELQQLSDFIINGTSPYHAATHAEKVLLEAGFIKLPFREDWKLEKGGRYYTFPFPTTLYAFSIGEHADFENHEGEKVHIAGAHLDFPALKIKPHPELFRHGYMQLNTEVYGGANLHTWFDRPLSLAGTVTLEHKDGIESRLLDFHRPILYIPNLAIHMNREVNEKGAQINRQQHMLPLLGMTGEDDSGLTSNSKFADLIAAELGCSAEEICDYDLNIYNPAEPVSVGINEDFISSPRLDDLTSVSALVHGLIDSCDKSRINLVCLFDNEEVGSLSKQGAHSTLPFILLQKIWQAFGKDELRCMSDLTSGLLISADVAHAYHPNYPAPQDITNFPVLGGGVILKTAANQSYAWDPRGLSEIIYLCHANNIPFQRFVKESNTKGGSTIGSIISSRLPMRTIDLGAGLLAMHSLMEVMGAKDQTALQQLMTAFFS